MGAFVILQCLPFGATALCGSPAFWEVAEHYSLLESRDHFSPPLLMHANFRCFLAFITALSQHFPPYFSFWFPGKLIKWLGGHLA